MKISRITICFTLLTTYACANMLIVGHRGACGYEAENTLKSFQRAIDMGVSMIELDVYVCKTGELVIMHDDDVDRTTNGNGHVVDMTFDQLRALKIDGTEQIPTLQEVIDLVGRKIPINIELKGPGTAKPVAALVKKYLAAGWKTGDFVISSFDHKQVAEFKLLHPTVKTGALFEPWDTSPKMIKAVEKCKADFIGLDLKAVTSDLVKLAHDAGFTVLVWTVNDKASADKMRAFKVDGIFSNYPDRV